MRLEEGLLLNVLLTEISHQSGSLQYFVLHFLIWEIEAELLGKARRFVFVNVLPISNFMSGLTTGKGKAIQFLACYVAKKYRKDGASRAPAHRCWSLGAGFLEAWSVVLHPKGSS